jgi:hypothetical protein
MLLPMRSRPLAWVWCLGLSLAGCSDVGSSPRTATLDRTQAQAIGALVAGQLQDLIGGLTAGDSGRTLSRGGFAAFLDPGSAVSRLAPLVAQARLLGPRYRFTLPSLAFPCHPQESDPEDRDRDGVAADDTLTFTPANCGGVDPESGLSTSVSGTVRIQDVGTIYGFQLTLTDFQIRVVPKGERIGSSISLNGTYRAAVGPAGATATQDLDYDFAIPGAPALSLGYNWDAEFTPLEGMRISPNRAWPNGTFEVSGNLDYSVGENALSFSLDTTSPLIFESGCTTPPPFSAGEIQGVLTSDKNVGFVLQHRHCGAPPTVSALRDAV